MPFARISVFMSCSPVTEMEEAYVLPLTLDSSRAVKSCRPGCFFCSSLLATSSAACFTKGDTAIMGAVASG